jgi:hypothetical protein
MRIFASIIVFPGVYLALHFVRAGFEEMTHYHMP